MHVHRFEKVWLALALVFIIGLISSVVYGAVGPGIEMIDDEGGQVAPGEYDGTGFEDPGVRQVGENEYEVYVIAQQFSFAPGTAEPIRVPANSRVTFYVTSRDVVHGFEVAGTNLNTMAIPGQVSKMTVEFGDPATYGVVCNEYCGPAHHEMAGRVVVVPESEYDGPGAANELAGNGTDGTVNGTDVTGSESAKGQTVESVTPHAEVIA